ncbi:GNAT family N-acetyltransferase [Paenibacillus sp.]|jgi:diamine N-acetyltransferase|uniref:GNAT family N-acetyltransferase n=1 Tax=Paenibacillus sp. TaxID=58172 RepID=UPI002839B7C4|nr:GNAT family N-acetyltransferase [Paenibacillus sp.]MDR0269536.1 GNAT family N-acetyltransferase [Paenibacillus sp.]
MANVYLKSITAENTDECLQLKPREDQQRFVAPNADSLEKAKREPTSRPYGIYADDIMIGFALFDEEAYPEDGYFWICRLMIDERFQGKGYGKAGLAAVLEHQKNQPNCTKIRISHVPDNMAANRLYKSFGFVETGEVIGGETVLDLILKD